MAHTDKDPRGTDKAMDHIWHACRLVGLFLLGGIVGLVVLVMCSVISLSAELKGACAYTPYVLDRTVTLAERFEGFRPIVEQDTSGDMVIGYGHSYGAFPDLSDGLGDIDPDYARVVLMEDLLDAQDAVCVHTKVPLSQNQLDALTLFVMNVGESAYAQSTLLSVVNRGDFALVPRELTRWVHDRMGHRLLGLARRRLVEGSLFSGVHIDINNPW